MTPTVAATASDGGSSCPGLHTLVVFRVQFALRMGEEVSTDDQQSSSRCNNRSQPQKAISGDRTGSHGRKKRQLEDAIQPAHLRQRQQPFTGFRKKKPMIYGASRRKKQGPPSRVAVVGQENIETVHAPKHIQAAGALCMDRVAVLWSDPTAHRPREMKGPVPSRFSQLDAMRASNDMADLTE
ncbi:hypothetical protein C8R45DRAFT_1128985 [Mycena sanguinolenta]|nr:hypothetical protein C8R45DRAFT_1128985 [Mycena sanguinolenta]